MGHETAAVAAARECYVCIVSFSTEVSQPDRGEHFQDHIPLLLTEPKPVMCG